MTPSPIAIEHAEPVADAVIVVGVEAGLHVERLRAVDVGDRDGDELEPEVHGEDPLLLRGL